MRRDRGVANPQRPLRLCVRILDAAKYSGSNGRKQIERCIASDRQFVAPRSTMSVLCMATLDF
jgi:hypothetical protein